MGASKKDFQIGEELVVLEMQKQFFEEHHDTIFKHCNVKRVYVKNDNFKDDQMYKNLLRTYMKASKELRDYEYEQLHNYHK